jgi:uncharacterized membrane protein
LIAFAVIASYWLQHHRMVASFVAIDVRTIVANLCLIAGIVLLPFSTAAVGDPSVEDLPLPTALMAVNVAVVSVLYTVCGLSPPAAASSIRLQTRVGGDSRW